MKEEVFIDHIIYGTPSREDKQNLSVSNYLDKLLPEFFKWRPPNNSSSATRQELNVLVDYANQMEQGKRIEIFDGKLVTYIEDIYITQGAEPDFIRGITKDLVDDLIPVITKLKYHFQRPRPNQLAYYYKLHFYPHFSYFVSSPSYPSTHATLATVICQVLGNHYPETYQVMLKFIKEVAESRLFMGVHYPTDIECANKISRLIFEFPEFKQKYKL